MNAPAGNFLTFSFSLTFFFFEKKKVTLNPGPELSPSFLSFQKRKKGSRGSHP
jgi:hypothetical protein